MCMHRLAIVVGCGSCRGGCCIRCVVGGCESYEPDLPEQEVELPISLREPDQTATMNVDSGVTCVL